jgi:hypothetical protein
VHNEPDFVAIAFEESLTGVVGTRGVSGNPPREDSPILSAVGPDFGRDASAVSVRSIESDGGHAKWRDFDDGDRNGDLLARRGRPLAIIDKERVRHADFVTCEPLDRGFGGAQGPVSDARNRPDGSGPGRIS